MRASQPVGGSGLPYVESRGSQREAFTEEIQITSFHPLPGKGREDLHFYNSFARHHNPSRSYPPNFLHHFKEDYR
jgi:hypothetical protein